MNRAQPRLRHRVGNAPRVPMISPRLAEITLASELAHGQHEFEHEETPADYAHPPELTS